MHLEEDVLRYLLGVFAAAQVTKGELVDLRSVGCGEVGQGLLVARLQPDKEVIGFGVAHGPSVPIYNPRADLYIPHVN